MSDHNRVPVIDAKAAAVARVAAKDDCRPALACVCIKDGWATAADGFRILRAQLPPPVPAPDIVKGGASAIVPDGAVLIPAKRVARLVKKSLSWFTRTPSGVAMATWDGDYGELTLTANQDYTFPDFEKIRDVRPAGEPIATISFNAELLSGTLDAMRRAGADETHGTVHVRIFGQYDPMELLAKDGDGRRIEAIVMPMVIGIDPEWESDQP